MRERRTHQAESTTPTRAERLLYLVGNALAVLGFLVAGGVATGLIFDGRVDEGVLILMFLAAMVGINVLARKLAHARHALGRERHAREVAEHTVDRLRAAETALLRDIKADR